MRALIRRNTLNRENFLMIIGIFLCVYFVYHAFQGQRSVTQLYALHQKIEKESEILIKVKNKRHKIEQKVVQMRSNALNKDVLEHQVRMKLGYIAPQERIILSN